MRNFRPFLVLFLASMFGVSILLPIEDIPETLYDESESVSFEITPLFSIQALKNCTGTRSADLSISPMATAIHQESLRIGERQYSTPPAYESTFLCTLLC